MLEEGRKLDEALDRHITGNYGEDQLNDIRFCSHIGGTVRRTVRSAKF